MLFILAERQEELGYELSNLRKRISLLDSYKVMKYITEEQYAKSMATIVDEVSKIEDEMGLNDAHLKASEVLYGDGNEKLNDLLLESQITTYYEKNGTDAESDEMRIF